MKAKLKTSVSLIALVGAVFFLQAASPNAKLDFEKALVLEEVEGRLEEAITLYQKIVSEAQDDALAAQAQLHIGICYEKLGKPQAREAYERVLREYADQAEQVSVARARLAALEEPSTPGEPSGLVVRQVWDRPAGAVSPDGRYLVFTRQDILRVHDLHTGGEHVLPAGSGMISGSPVISPDGELVTYVSFRDQEAELRTARLDGSSARVLVRSDEIPWLEPFDWLPDGKQILAVVSRQDRTNQIALISVADGSLRVVKSLEGRYPYKMSISPDDRYIAYDVADQPLNPQRDIFALATDGSRENPLVEHPARDLMAVWTPDGRGILFVSDRTGTLDLWTVLVRDGRPYGLPKLLRRNVGRGFAPVGFTRSGNYYYNEGGRLQDVYITSLDAETGQVTGPPTLASERYRGKNTLPEWSPDGQHLAYLSRLQCLLCGDKIGSAVIVVRSLDTGEERELSPQLNFLGDTRLRWAPDGRSFLISGEEVGGQKSDRRRGLYQIDAQTGEVAPIVVSPSNTHPGWRENRWHAEWSRDGKAIFYVRDDGQGCEIRFRDVKTGEERLIHHPASPVHLSNLALSPDGRWLAFGYGSGHYAAEAVLVIPASGGQPREVLRLDPNAVGRQTYSFAWTRDGRHLLFSKRVTEPGRPSELWRAPVEGGKPERLGLPMWGRGGVRVHPDGSRIAFTNMTPAGGLWVMENFLPELSSLE